MEGWLYLFRSNRLGLQYSRKRYFVLDHRDNSLSCYRAAPTACTQVVALPLPSLTFCSMFSWSKTCINNVLSGSCKMCTNRFLHPCKRQWERKYQGECENTIKIQKVAFLRLLFCHLIWKVDANIQVFFLFTLYNTSNHSNQLKVKASELLSRRRSHMHSFALREMFHAKLGKCPSSDVSVKEQKADISLSLTEDVEGNVQLPVENRKSEERTEGSQESDTKPASMSGSFLELNDAADEFFDFPDEPEYDKQEDMWPSDSQLQHQQPKLSTAAVLMKRLQGLAGMLCHSNPRTVHLVSLVKHITYTEASYRNSKFRFQGNTEEELPEFLLGTCRLNHLDASKAISIKSW
ncbi:hypothetical protein B296_00039655 [Ensete ventricosum]|uniref:Uncharacterized protein n=1 Tax=Ensete ventricosum TaxID=4639 RepID=A0A426ZHB3_ENSVE|nr:hypothetical protein B296_00039655 [Ensete ventricosum]